MSLYNNPHGLELILIIQFLQFRILKYNILITSLKVDIKFEHFSGVRRLLYMPIATRTSASVSHISDPTNRLASPQTNSMGFRSGE
jgi:hypothetical protein